MLWRDAEFNWHKENMKIKEVIKIKVYDGLTMEILAEERDDDIAILTLKLPLIFSSEVSIESIEYNYGTMFYSYIQFVCQYIWKTMLMGIIQMMMVLPLQRAKKL